MRRVAAALFSVALLFPATARAADNTLPIIGWLSGQSEAQVMALRRPAITIFRERLAADGLVEGRDFAFTARWGENQPGRLPALAAELVHMPVAVIVVTGGLPAVQAARAVTKTIPIVFAVGVDPVKVGLVERLNHPGGNLTGMTGLAPQLMAKQIGLLHEVVPTQTRIALLYDPREAGPTEIGDTATEALRLGLSIDSEPARNPDELDAIFAKIAAERVGGIVIGPGAFGFVHRKRVIELAARYAIPAIYSYSDATAEAGLMSYGADFTALWNQAADYGVRILKGDHPGELPVQQPAKFELLVNQKTARTLGLEISPVLLAGADELIE